MMSILFLYSKQKLFYHQRNQVIRPLLYLQYNYLIELQECFKFEFLFNIMITELFLFYLADDGKKNYL